MQQRILVTGAGRGVGREISILFARNSSRLVIADINLENLQTTKSICLENGATECHIVQFDAGKRSLQPSTSKSPPSYTSDSYRLVQETINLLGGLNILIIQHTLPQYHPILTVDSPEQVSIEAYQHMNVNYLGYVDLAISALPHLIESAQSSNLSSSITIVSSLAASIPMPNCAQYSASKAAIESFFDSLALEMSQSPIQHPKAKYLSDLVTINKVTFSMILTPVLIEAMTKAGNASSLSHGVDAVEAARQVVETSTRRSIPSTSLSVYVPSSSSILISLYNIIPSFIRFLVDKVGKSTVLSSPSTSPSFLNPYLSKSK